VAGLAWCAAPLAVGHTFEIRVAARAGGAEGQYVMLLVAIRPDGRRRTYPPIAVIIAPGSSDTREEPMTDSPGPDD
jgi:hypothetical protein